MSERPENIAMPDEKGSQLFRQEAIDARCNQGFGQIRLSQPLSIWIGTIGSVFIAVALGLFMSLASVTRKAHVGGITVPSAGTITVSSTNAGVLTRLMVTEGQTVIAGQSLLELSTERLGGNGEVSALVDQQLTIRKSAVEAEKRIRISQAKSKQVHLNARLANTNRSIEQIDLEITLGKRRSELALKTVNQYESLEKQGFAAAAQTQQKVEDSIDSGTRLSSLIRNRLQLKADALATEAELSELTNGLAADLSQLDRSLASIAQESAENQSRKSTLIVAPQSGSITGITYKVGQAVGSGQVIATMIPFTTQNSAKDKVSLEVHLYVPSKTAGFIAAGQTVKIRYQAFPYQKFGLSNGVIEDVSATPFAPSELPSNLASTILARAQQNSQNSSYVESLYRVKVRLEKQYIFAYGKPTLLKPGMTLDADIIQDRRSVFEWVIDPISAIAER